MESCHPAAARRVKLWSQNANVLFEEPQQLTKLNHIWERTFPFKALIAIFWDLQPLWPCSLTKSGLLRFRRSSGHVLSKTKPVTPHFFTFLTSLTHHLSMVKFSDKNQCTNVLNSQVFVMCRQCFYFAHQFCLFQFFCINFFACKYNANTVGKSQSYKWILNFFSAWSEKVILFQKHPRHAS